jgi:hypothetical protein
MSKLTDIDAWRKFHLALAEFVDAWRIIPRAVVVMFGWGSYEVVKWYIKLEPYMLEGCVEAGGTVAECLIQAPSTQHTALVSALFALAAAVFAFYSNNGRKWNGFTHWNQIDEDDIFWRDKHKKDESTDVDHEGTRSVQRREKGGNGG